MQKSLEKRSDLSAVPTPGEKKRREAGLEKRSLTTAQFGVEDQKANDAKTMCQTDVAVQHGRLGTWGTHQGKAPTLTQMPQGTQSNLTTLVHCTK